MQRKTTLYIDIDDTIIAQVLPGSGFDLRPFVITQLTVLGRMYDCCWLTSWPYIDPAAPCSVSVSTLIRSLYGARINETFRYADWDPRPPRRQSRLCPPQRSTRRLVLARRSDPERRRSRPRCGRQTRSLHPCPADRRMGFPRRRQRTVPAQRKNCRRYQKRRRPP